MLALATANGFTTSNEQVIDSVYDDSVGASCYSLSSDVVRLEGQTANLPDSCGSTLFENPDQLFGYDFPMYLSGNYHWATAGFGARWECDDYANSAANATNHQVWVR